MYSNRALFWTPRETLTLSVVFLMQSAVPEQVGLPFREHKGPLCMLRSPLLCRPTDAGSRATKIQNQQNQSFNKRWWHMLFFPPPKHPSNSLTQGACMLADEQGFPHPDPSWLHNKMYHVS